VNLKKTTLVLALSLAVFGCSTPEFKSVSTHALKNERGHVIGHKEVLRDVRSGQDVEQITLYIPRIGERGEIVGYEEPITGGAILRDLDGRRTGARYVDLRSRGTNPYSEGLTINIFP